MAKESYKKQVELLLDIIPIVSKESCFALYGGTAINLFYWDMPRLSIDIDLTYLPIEDRALSLININDALKRIKNEILKIIPNASVELNSDVSKLFISKKGVQIKVEVNQIKRGSLFETKKSELCEKAQNDYGVFCTISTLSIAQSYGGKMCAALDRQHPRDLFDIKISIR